MPTSLVIQKYSSIPNSLVKILLLQFLVPYSVKLDKTPMALSHNLTYALYKCHLLLFNTSFSIGTESKTSIVSWGHLAGVRVIMGTVSLYKSSGRSGPWFGSLGHLVSLDFGSLGLRAG